MFTREYRLPSATSLTQAKVIKTPFFLLKLKANNLSHNRYGFVVSKRVDKRAVVRNRLRRVCSSFLEKQNASLKGGYDILVVISSQAKDKEQDMLQLLKLSLEQANIVNEN